MLKLKRGGYFMKINLIINDELEETEIKIYAKEYSEHIEKIMKQLQVNQLNFLDGYLGQEIYMVKISDIYIVNAEEAKVFLHTDEQEYEVKRKLYEIENQFLNDFVRVSKSSLVNINRIASIQVGRIGSTELILDNDVSINVSRKYLKELKHHLGIGREI